ncbi:hypothetical protein BGZ58_005483, partial [Dissophora ornata]
MLFNQHRGGRGGRGGRNHPYTGRCGFQGESDVVADMTIVVDERTNEDDSLSLNTVKVRTSSKDIRKDNTPIVQDDEVTSFVAENKQPEDDKGKFDTTEAEKEEQKVDTHVVKKKKKAKKTRSKKKSKKKAQTGTVLSNFAMK